MKELGQYFGLHYSMVSRIIKQKKARPDPVTPFLMTSENN
jgi:hypothetical protein